MVNEIQKIVNDINSQGWLYALNNNKIPEQFFRDNSKFIPNDFTIWNAIFQTQELSEEFLAFNKSKLEMDGGINWAVISGHQQLSEDFIRQFKNKLDWDFIVVRQNLSEDFIEKHSKFIDWWLLGAWQELSDAFIDKHSDKLDMEQLLKYEDNKKLKRYGKPINS